MIRINTDELATSDVGSRSFLFVESAFVSGFNEDEFVIVDKSSSPLPGDWKLVESSSGLALEYETIDRFSYWIGSYGYLGSDALADADPDGDGLVNAIEFVLGSSPVRDDQADRPSVSIVQNGGVDYLRFSYLHHGHSSDVTGSGEYSTDLVSWSDLDTVPGHYTSTSTLLGSSSVFPNMILVREHIPYDPEAMPKVFVRLQAQISID